MTVPGRVFHRVVLLLPLLLTAREGYGQSITHQITLASNQSWCDDTMINGLLTQINTFRAQNGVPALTMDTLGMKDAEIRATQFAAYMAANSPSSPGFNPHQGYDTTAASLGYNLYSENLAYITSTPSYIVFTVWQDSLHIAAMLATQANVAGVSCIYSNGTPYWTYEPGYSSGAPTQQPPPPPSGGSSTLDAEQWSFLTLINNYRAQNGVGPLQVSVQLQQSSQWMSNDLATNNGFSHTDSLGRDPGTRMAAFGYPHFPWGENIAAGYSDAQNTLTQWANACDPDQTGACTYAHRKNMLGAGFVAIGIGRAFGSNSAYGWYWTTDFGGFLDQAITPSSGAAPTIASFTATSSSITAGQSSTLAWSVSGATSVTLDNGIGAVAAVATRSVSPTQTTTYKLTAANSGGTTTAFATVTVTAPPVCTTFTISASSRTVQSSGGTGSVSVTATAGCTWTASSNAAWLTVTSGSSGSGTGVVAYSVAANQTAAQRQGILTIAGNTFTVTEPPALHIASKAGIFRSSFFVMAQDVNGNLAWDAGTDRTGNFGVPGDQIFFGDWDGSGTSKMGIFRPSNGLIALDMNGNLKYDAGVDKIGIFGQSGDVAIVGDWSGDGKSKVGIFRPSSAFFALDVNGNLKLDAADKTGTFGAAGDVPLVGDWTGDGKAKVGIFRNGTWALDLNGNILFDPGVDGVGGIGQAGDVPLLGDWNGDGRTKVGIYRASMAMFGLDYNGNLVWDSFSDRAGNFGISGDTPIAGDWDGTGVTRIGIYRNGAWAMDMDGNIAWNPGTDHAGGYGSSGDQAIVGRWQ